MTLLLDNPRSYVRSAQITWDGEKAHLCYTNIWDSYSTAWCNSITAAKALFSRNVLRPKHHGPNIWKRANIKTNER
jgi:hypothetical protein